MKNSTTTQNVSNKQIADNKQNVINLRKKEILVPKKNILDMNLDELDTNNLKDLIKKTKSLNVEKNSNERFQMYKFERLGLTEKEEKRQRTKIRKQRNKFIDNLIYFFFNDKDNELKNEIDLFNKFYKETYNLNDYSISSLASDNSDVDTKEKIKIVLNIIKTNVVGVTKKKVVTPRVKKEVIKKEIVQPIIKEQKEIIS